MEYRKIMGNIHHNTNQAGTFNFARGATGLIGVNSGSPIASFLLGAVDDANSAFRAADAVYPRQHAWIFHAGRHVARQRQAHARLRTALGLLLAVVGEV